MKLLDSGPERRVVAAALVVAVALCLWLFVFSGSKPDEALLIQRMKASISLGWGWLHVENISIARQETQGGNYTVTFDYSVVLDQDEAALPPEERMRFRRFLPMCSNLPIARGTSCSLREEMLFVHTWRYGWMPDPFIKFRPELLKDIADWKDPLL